MNPDKMRSEYGKQLTDTANPLHFCDVCHNLLAIMCARMNTLCASKIIRVCVCVCVVGKLMYMLMDSANNEVRELLEFNCVKPLTTVASFLEARGGLKVLTDPLMQVATAEIVAGAWHTHTHTLYTRTALEPTCTH